MIRHCPACGCIDATPVETIRLREQYTLYAPHNNTIQKQLRVSDLLPFHEYEVIWCQHCRLEYANPMKAPGAEWYTYAYNILDLHASDRWEFNYVYNHLTPQDSVGEIGCGIGKFLRKCQNGNISCQGIDFCPSSVHECCSLGISATVCDLSDKSFLGGGKKTVIVSFHVLEHFENPHKFFRFAYSWSAEKARLWVSVPSDKRLHRLLQEKDHLDDPPHHLTRWTPRAFAEIGKRNGWNLVGVIYEPVRFLSSLYSVCIRHMFYKKLRALNNGNQWIDRTIRYGLYPAISILQFRILRALSGFSMIAEFIKA
jgi:hypothetical protein